MFKVGDLVKVFDVIVGHEYVGFVESVVDGKVGVRWLNDDMGDNRLSVYTNPLDFLKLCDKVEE